jgi:hypothetical protein
MKKLWLGIAAAVVLIGMAAFFTGRDARLVQEAAESAARAKAALLHSLETQKYVDVLLVERDSLVASARRAEVVRSAKTSSGTFKLAQLGPEPAEKPDTCGAWIKRARDAESAAVDLRAGAIAAAGEIVDLTEALDKANESVRLLQEDAAIAKPVLEEHSVVKLPASQSLGARLVSAVAAVLPDLHVGYGATLTPQGTFHHGATVSLGYKISLGKIL